MADKLVAVRIKQQDNTYSNEIPIGAKAENVAYDNTKNLLQVLGTIDMYKGDVQTQLNALFENFNGIAEDVAEAIDSWVTEHMPSWDPETHLDDTLTADNLAPVSSAVPKLIAVNEAEIQGTKMKISTTGQEDLTVLTPNDIDNTLSQQGEAADAKATGEMIMINNAATAGTKIRLVTTEEDISFLTEDDIDNTLSIENTPADAKATGNQISIGELTTVEYSVPNLPVSAWSQHLINATTGVVNPAINPKSISTVLIPFDEKSTMTFTGITRGANESNNRIIYIYYYDINKNYLGRSNFSSAPIAGTKFIRFLYGFLTAEAITVESYGFENLVNDWSVNTKSFAEKKLPYITPAMFEAVGDGITDDSDALQKTFNNGNNKIIILDKVYLVSKMLNLPPDSKVICSGTIKHNIPSTDDAVINFGNRCCWDGGTFEGPGAKSGETHTLTRAVLYVNSKTDVIIKNVKIYDTPYAYCIGIKAGTDIVIENNQINRYNYGGICLIDGTINGRISNNKIENGVGINLGSDNTTPIRYPISGSLYEDLTVTRPAKNITIDKNYIYDSETCWEGIDFHGGYNIKINENNIFGVSTGITLTNFVDQNIRVQKVVIENNYIELGIVSDGEKIARNNSGIVISRTDEIIASGNIIKNPGYATIAEERNGAGIQIVKTTKATVAENILENIYKFGVYIIDSENIIISENRLTGGSWATTHSTSAFILIDPPIDLTTSDYNILIENNIAENLARIYWGMNPNSIKNTDKIYFGNNKCNAANRISIINPEGIIPYKLIDPSIINSLAVGVIGDFIYNGNPEEHPYLGWICTKSGTNAEKAVWREISL